MLRFLFFILLLFILIPFFVLIMRILSGGFRMRNRRNTGFDSQGQQTNTKSTNNGKKSKKVFSDNEGEYVEFEEVKEDEKKEEDK